MASTGTAFSNLYSSFLSKITDDMYMELTKEDTQKLLQELLINAIPWFEFPKQSLEYTTDGSEKSLYVQKKDKSDVIPYYTRDGKKIMVKSTSTTEEPYFINELTAEEKNILTTYMACEWLNQQIATVENTRMKYSGSDFKFTSQANHIAKLIALRKDYERQGLHLQRLYKRRYIKDGKFKSSFSLIMRGPDEDDA